MYLLHYHKLQQITTEHVFEVFTYGQDNTLKLLQLSPSKLFVNFSNSQNFSISVISPHGFPQDHPYNTAPSDDCWEGRMDRLLVWEPSLLPNNSQQPTPTSGALCLCRSSVIGAPSRPPKPVTTITSSTESLTLELVVDAGHAASSYFKHPSPLFEAR